MMTESEKKYLQRCKLLIEERVGWGSHEHWTNQDFIRLSELILNQTGVNLSATTLKRIWGRVKYDNVPHVTTLDALAKFAGYPHWRVFKLECYATLAEQEQDVQVQLTTFYDSNTPAQSCNQDKKAIVRSVWIMLMIFTAGSMLLGLIFSNEAERQSASVIASKDFAFTGLPVTNTLPNTVIFDYDASAATTDSIYIQPYGDPQQKIKLSKYEHQYSSMYYYPGAYQAKLIVNDQVVRQHEVLIQTNGWLALVEGEEIPLYFKDDIINQGVLGLSLKTLESHHLDMQNKTPWVAYYNVRDFGNLQSDNFILDTEVKHDFNKGNAVCQDTSVVILRSDAPPITIPLSIPGCLANLDKKLRSQAMKADQVNLLAFGTDFSDWVKIRCEAKDQQFRLFINQQLAYQGSLLQEASKIIGIAYRFQGTGTVNYIRLSQSDDKHVYYEDFSG